MGKWATTLFYVFATMHIPISQATHLPLHWVAGAICLFAILSEVELAKTPAHLPFMGYVSLLLLAVIHSMQAVPVHNVLLASMSYLVMPAIFLTALTRDPMGKITMIAKVNTWLALSSVAAAAYQLYVDPLLFGIYAGTSYENLSGWALPRASGLQGSPQVLSAYMAFSVILYDAFRPRAQWRVDAPVIGLMLLGALLSGSVASVAGVACYFVVKTIVRAPVMIFIWPLMAGAIFAALTVVHALGVFGERSPASRVLAIVEGGLGNGERVGKWLDAIAATPPIWGNGIGSASTLIDGASRFNTESYILNVYYEGGLVLITAFALVVLAAATAIVPSRMNAKRWGFLAAFFFTAMIVHAFYAVALPIVWLLLFGFINIGVQRSYSSSNTRQAATSPSV